MPPKAAPQKRKRGRPSAAPRRSASPDAQGAQQPTYEGDGEDESRPKKRGRPPRNLDTDESAPPVPAQQQEKRKRGRPSLGKSMATPEKTAGRGRGRPPAKAVDASPDAPAETPEETAKSRGRPRKSPETTEDSSAPAQKEKRKRGRPSMGNTMDETPKRQRGRPPRASLQNQAEEEAIEDVEEAEEQQPAEKASEQDGRSKKGRKKQQEEPQDDPTRQKQPGKATTKADKPPAQGAKAPAPSKSKQKRAPQNSRQPGDDGDTSADEEIPRSPSKPYAHVSETLVHIPQATIDAKWSPLNDPSIANATTTLSLAHRPVIQTVATTGRDAQHHAVAALDLVQSRIARKMRKGLPFPPAASNATGALGRRADARGAELDFESVLGGAAALQRQLEPALHAVELLRREKRRAQEELERDYISLQNLEAGARGQARERKQLLKRAHPLAPESTVSRSEDLEMVFGKRNGGGAVFKDLEDEGLRDLAMQLSGHVESMRANLAQVDGIAPRMDAGRAALRSVLLEHLDQATYDQVVLG
ncbi:hypothetical protein N3K66_002547 [Trichothecium roseum]|uniref:Uncharacterized protein n=1 Tax=Trichothecium roseum TaxID=47278 RepID=A0ACC0VBJ6_9HYPO|nr:hypothetical protein N3K66_002547 [Trichothecium roseum]